MRHLLLILVLLACPATASADTLDTQLDQLRNVATEWWAGYGLTETTCGSVIFERTTLPADSGDQAWLVEGTSIDEYHLWVPVCHVVVNSANLIGAAPAQLCTVVLHEWGHVLGLPHSTDPTNIMYGGHLIAPPPVCAAWGAAPHKGSEDPLMPARNSTRNARWAAVRAQRRLGRDLQVAWRHGRTERQIIDR